MKNEYPIFDGDDLLDWVPLVDDRPARDRNAAGILLGIILGLIWMWLF